MSHFEVHIWMYRRINRTIVQYRKREIFTLIEFNVNQMTDNRERIIRAFIFLYPFETNYTDYLKKKNKDFRISSEHFFLFLLLLFSKTIHS